MIRNYKAMAWMFIITATVMCAVIYWDITTLKADYTDPGYLFIKTLTIGSYYLLGLRVFLSKKMDNWMEDFYILMFHTYSWYGMAYIDMTYNYSFIEAILIAAVFLRQSTPRFLITLFYGLIVMLVGYQMASEPSFVLPGESYKPHSMTISFLLAIVGLCTHLLIQKYQKKFMELNEKFALIGRQSSFLMHEIKNPLSRVVANSEGEVSIDLLRDIHQDSQKISSLVTSLETLIHRPHEISLTFAHFDLKEIKDILIRDYESYLNTMNIDFDFSELSGPFFGNRHLIYQLHKNLLINAIEAIGYRKTEKSLIKIIVKHANGSVKIEFLNNNSSIPIKFLEQIFEPHFSTKAEKSNKGLGLYLSRSIVEAHRGNIIARSSNNQTSFLIELKK